MIRLLPLLLLATAAFGAEPFERVHRVPLGNGAELPVLELFSSTAPKATLVLFPGGAGNGVFREDGGHVLLNSNFLSRIARELAMAPVKVLLLDSPSDLPQGMTDEVRVSERSADDVARAVAQLSVPGKPVIYVGNSRGTLSAVSVALRSGYRGAPLILTSTVAGNETLAGLPVSRLRSPVLYIHHESDTCPSAKFAVARQFAGRLARRVPLELIRAKGGRTESQDPCDARTYHGFLGLESQLTPAIASWIARLFP